MIKQIIVIRKDLNMRKGKIAAQASHASMGVLLDMMSGELYSDGLGKIHQHRKLIVSEGTYLYDWLNGSFTKICVSVDSEEELYTIENAFDLAGIKTKLIIDNGATEFNGVKTPTCLATEPFDSDELNKITGHLKLL